MFNAEQIEVEAELEIPSQPGHSPSKSELVKDGALD